MSTDQTQETPNAKDQPSNAVTLVLFPILFVLLLAAVLWTTLERAEAMDADVYVPGHGIMEAPTVLRRELAEYREAVKLVIAEATKHHAAGLSLEEAVQTAQFGDLETLSLRDSQVPRAIERVYMELRGELPR